MFFFSIIGFFGRVNYQSAFESIHLTPRGGTCICRDTGMCHYFGYFFGVASGFLGTFLGYSRIFGYHFLVEFDFFQNNPDFGVLILIFPSMTLLNVACRALVSMMLQFSFLFYCAKSSITATRGGTSTSFVRGCVATGLEN